MNYRKMQEICIKHGHSEVDHYKIHSFEMIDQPIDFNIKKKQWNKLKQVVDKMYPKFKKE